MSHRNHDGRGFQYMKSTGEGTEADPIVPSTSDTSLEQVLETSDRGSKSLAVTLQDQGTPAFDFPFVKILDTTLIRTTTAVDDRTIAVTSGHTATANDFIVVSDGQGLYIETRIASVTVDTITTNAPMNGVYPVGTNVLIASDEMLVDGSGTPEKFIVKPPAGTVVDITGLTFVIETNTKPDISLFGGDPELGVGITLRRRFDSGDYAHLATITGNLEFTLNGALEIPIEPKITGSAVYGFGARVTYSGQENHGVAIRLDSSLDEYVEIYIPDNLTGGQNTSFRAMAQGSEVQGD